MSRRRPLGLFVLLVAAGVGLWWWRRGSAPSSTGAPVATPVTETPAELVAPSVAATGPEPALTGWTAPVDGECPPGFPVKVNTTSGIYHVPGGRFYDRASPQRCYATAERAEDDGYRRAKA